MGFDGVWHLLDTALKLVDLYDSSLDQFNYYHVLTSVILGLGITQVLTGYGYVLRNRNRMKRCSPLMQGWGALALVTMIQFWHSGWVYRPDNFSVPMYFYMLFQTVVFYLFSTILFPDFGSKDVTDRLIDERKDAKDERYDLRVYYTKNVLVMCGFAFLIVALGLGFNFIIVYSDPVGQTDWTEFYQKLVIRVVFVALLFYILQTSRNEIKRHRKQYYKPLKRLSEPTLANHLLATQLFGVALIAFIGINAF